MRYGDTMRGPEGTWFARRFARALCPLPLREALRLLRRSSYGDTTAPTTGTQCAGQSGTWFARRFARALCPLPLREARRLLRRSSYGDTTAPTTGTQCAGQMVRGSLAGSPALCVPSRFGKHAVCCAAPATGTQRPQLRGHNARARWYVVRSLVRPRFVSPPASGSTPSAWPPEENGACPHFSYGVTLDHSEVSPHSKSARKISPSEIQSSNFSSTSWSAR